MVEKNQQTLIDLLLSFTQKQWSHYCESQVNYTMNNNYRLRLHNNESSLEWLNYRPSKFAAKAKKEMQIILDEGFHCEHKGHGKYIVTESSTNKKVTVYVTEEVIDSNCHCKTWHNNNAFWRYIIV